MDKLFENDVVSSNVTCKKGCTACCHTQVSVTADEAALLANRITSGTEIDTARLLVQGEALNDSQNWYELPYQLRACVFIGDQGECTVYDDRPSVCRTNNVFSSPRDCSTLDGKEKPVRLLNTEIADLLLIGSYIHSMDNGALPHMLWRELRAANYRNVKIPVQNVYEM
jgi:uncharacterized protein